MASKREISPDVDKGWAFVMMLFGTLNVALFTGFPYLNSIFYVIFLEEFEESPVITSWATNLNMFCAMILAPVGNLCITAIGARLTLVVGCIISTIGVVVCSFATTVPSILVTFGILTGAGFSFGLLATLITVPVYFKKYRKIANSVINAGAGLGQFVFAPFIRFLVEEYHWRGALLIFGAINLNLLVSAAVFMPPRYSSPEPPNQITHSNKKTRKRANTFKTIHSDLSMFRCPIWSLHSIGRTFMLAGASGFVTHILNLDFPPGVEFLPWQQKFLPSILGIGGTAGRLLVGPFLHLTKIPVMIMYIALYTTLFIVSIVISLVVDYAAMATCCFIAGIAMGGSVLIFEVIIHIAGLEKYNSGVSNSMVCSGIGLLIGGPFAEWIYEMDPSYGWSYRVVGIIVLIGVLLNIPAWLTLAHGKIRHRAPKESSASEKSEPSTFNEEKLLS